MQFSFIVCVCGGGERRMMVEVEVGDGGRVGGGGDVCDPQISSITITS